MLFFFNLIFFLGVCLKNVRANVLGSENFSRSPPHSREYGDFDSGGFAALMLATTGALASFTSHQTACDNRIVRL